MLKQNTPAAQPQTAPAPRQVVVTIELSKPLPGHHGEIYAVELRAPEFADWVECGDIHETIVIDPAAMQRGEPGAAKVTVRAEAVAKWFQRLSGLPYAALGKLAMKDARAVFGEVVTLVGSLDAGNSAPRQ